MRNEWNEEKFLILLKRKIKTSRGSLRVEKLMCQCRKFEVLSNETLRAGPVVECVRLGFVRLG